MTNCNPNRSCGCIDRGYSTQPPCAQNTPECPNPDPCPETFDSQCIAYMGDTIVDAGINQGDRLTDIIQKLVLMISNPTCFVPDSTCFSVLSFKSTLVTNNAIALSWIVVGSPSAITVEYKEESAVAWTLTPSLAPTATAATLSGLTSETTYLIRVSATCNKGDCYSVTIKVTTK